MLAVLGESTQRIARETRQLHRGKQRTIAFGILNVRRQGSLHSCRKSVAFNSRLVDIRQQTYLSSGSQVMVACNGANPCV